MNRASYTETVTATEGTGKYPLSTETLDFIQKQIVLLEALAGIGGGKYILRAPDGTNEGVAVIVNKDEQIEVVTIAARPVFSNSIKYLTLTTKRKDIEADGEVYKEARTLQQGQFTTDKGAESYDINGFANVEGGALSKFPTNAILAARVKNMPQTVLNSLRDVLAEKLTAKTVVGLTQKQLDGLKTGCVLSCTRSIALFEESEYTVVVTEQGGAAVRQELIQGENVHYVRMYDGMSWGDWIRQVETAMHLDVKIVGKTVFIRHGALAADCDIVLLRKKRRSSWRSTGGANAYLKNRGRRQKRLPKKQYVHFKGVKLSKGTPGQWYVPKCVDVADRKMDGDLVGKEILRVCESLFYVGDKGVCRMQGCRKKMVLKSEPNKRGTQHQGYASIGVQIARLKPTGGKDAGGEIARMKYRISQKRCKTDTGTVYYEWVRSVSIE